MELRFKHCLSKVGIGYAAIFQYVVWFRQRHSLIADIGHLIRHCDLLFDNVRDIDKHTAF